MKFSYAISFPLRSRAILAFLLFLADIFLHFSHYPLVIFCTQTEQETTFPPLFPRQLLIICANFHFHSFKLDRSRFCRTESNKQLTSSEPTSDGLTEQIFLLGKEAVAKRIPIPITTVRSECWSLNQNARATRSSSNDWAAGEKLSAFFSAGKIHRRQFSTLFALSRWQRHWILMNTTPLFSVYGDTEHTRTNIWWSFIVAVGN